MTIANCLAWFLGKEIQKPAPALDSAERLPRVVISLPHGDLIDFTGSGLTVSTEMCELTGKAHVIVYRGTEKLASYREETVLGWYREP